MENKKQLGGKRKGAGRKPVLSKKKQVSLYVEGVKIIKFGNEEKLKEEVYRFIDGYGKDEPLESGIKYAVPTPDAYNGKNMGKVIHDEFPMFPQPKANQFTAYAKEISDAVSVSQIEAISQSIRFDTELADWQKKRLNEAAVAKSKTFEFND